MTQLAVNGGYSQPLFENLVDDKHFKGTIVYEVSPSLSFAHPPADKRRAVHEMLSYAQMQSLVDRLETRLRIFFQHHFVLLRSEFQPENLLRSVLKTRRPPTPSPHRTRLDRFIEADYSGKGSQNSEPDMDIDIEGVSQQSVDAFEERLNKILRRVDVLKKRGAQVFFVRLPSSGAVAAIERERWPRDVYWDALEQALPGHTFHFEDDPRTRQLAAQDLVHLDHDNALRFTDVLAEHLSR